MPIGNQNADVLIVVKAVMQDAKKQINAIKKNIDKMGRTSNVALKGMEKQFKRIDKATELGRRSIEGSRKQFQAWALGIMFAGMIIVNTMKQIWRASSKTFNDVQHSVEGSVTGFDILTGSMQYLGFTIGAALEPIAMFLAPIIDKIADWVTNNEELVRTLFIFILAFGAILLTVGQFSLAINSLLDMFGKLKVAMNVGWLSDFFGFLSGIGLGGILGIIAAIAALYVAWKTNFGGIRDFVKNTFNIIWSTIKSVFGNITEIFSGFFMLLKGIFTGDFKLLWNGAVKIVLNAIAAIIKIVWGIGTVMVNVGIFIINTIKDIMFSAIKLIIGGIQVIAGWVDNVFGTNFAAAIQTAKDKVTSWQNALTIDYVSGDTVSAGNDAIDKITNQIEVFCNIRWR